MIVRRSSQLRSWLASIEVRCARRTSELAATGESEPPESLLGDDGNRSSRDAVGITRRRHACDAMPSFEEALAAGVITGDHVDAVARVLRGLDAEVRAMFIGYEAQLLAAAGRERIVMFDRTCRDLAKCLIAERDRCAGVDTEAAEFERQRAAAKIKQWVDNDSGMHHTHVELDPERGTRLADVLRAQLRRIVKQDGNSGRPYNQLEIDAFMAAIESGVTRRTTGRGDEAGELEVVAASAELRVPDVTLLIDHHTLHHGHHDHGICETAAGIPLPVETARRLCCDAEVTLATLDANGVVRDLGRTQRTVNRAQRRELRAMHRTCVGRGCEVPFDQCQIHHVVFWRNDGNTNIDNLVPVCSRHHHLAHEGGWTLTMTPDRVITWTRPDGTIDYHGTAIDRAPNGIPPPGTAPPGTGPPAPPDRHEPDLSLIESLRRLSISDDRSARPQWTRDGDSSRSRATGHARRPRGGGDRVLPRSAGHPGGSEAGSPRGAGRLLVRAGRSQGASRSRGRLPAGAESTSSVHRRRLRSIVRDVIAAGFDVQDDEPLDGFDRAYVSDPFGNRIELLQPLAQPGGRGR